MTIRVLLAEDNPDHQKIVTFILSGRGHAVDIAGDGQQAIHMAQENRYDVIVMDMKMPGMDGLEATKAIRTRENGNRRVPIIALTAYAMKGDRERCLAAGMDGYLSKPINGQEMIMLVETLATRAVADGRVQVSIHSRSHRGCGG
jgi:two-component system, sensor histidine kinase and response regulator